MSASIGTTTLARLFITCLVLFAVELSYVIYLLGEIDCRRRITNPNPPRARTSVPYWTRPGWCIPGVINSLLRLAAVDDSPPWYDGAARSRAFPSHALFETQEALHSIQEEAQQLSSAPLPAFSEVDRLHRPIDKHQKWRVLILKWYGDYVGGVATSATRTRALLSAAPEVKAAMFSVLPPGVSIPAHMGPFAGALRYHLTLRAPEDCYITVAGETRHYQTGTSWLFDDTYLHAVHNGGNESRVVLFLDVLRPSAVSWLLDVGISTGVVGPLIDALE